MKLFNLSESLKNPPEVKKFKNSIWEYLNNGGMYGDEMVYRLTKEAEAILKDGGWKYVGNGAYSGVFSNPKYDYILKIFQADEGYVSWWNFCKANQGNKYVPKIRGGMIRVADAVYATRLERLLEVKGGEVRAAQDLLHTVSPKYKDAADPELRQIQMFLKKFAIDFDDEHFESLDLRTANIMKRPNGEFVITDPLSYA